MSKRMKSKQALHQKQADDGYPSRPAALCPECGYDLRGTRSKHCSECGVLIDWEAALQHGHFGQMTPVQEWAVWCAKVYGMLLAAFLISVYFKLTYINSLLDRITIRWYLIPIVATPLHIFLALFANIFGQLGGTTATAITAIVLSCLGCLLLGAYIMMGNWY